MNAHSNDDLGQAARARPSRALAEISAAKGPDRERILKAHSRIAGAYAHQGWLDGTVAFNALLAAATESGLVRETDECYVGGIIRSEMQQGALDPPPLSPSVEAVTAPIGSLPQCEREAGLQPAPQPVVVPDAPIKSALAPIAHTASASLYNESDVKAFLVLLNNHVAALASKLPQDCPVGKMQLVFIHPSTGAVTERRYCVGDVEGMLVDVRVYAHTHNVYIGGRTIRDDAIITQGGRGTFEATGLVYALVVDDDTGVLRNNVAATLEVKTSESRRHKWLLLDTFVWPEAAAALGLRLNRFAGADHCTGRVAHIYRVPGTPNWPNAKKIAEGRKPEPTSLSPQRGKLWSPEAMLNTFPRVDELPQEEGMPQRGYVAPRDDDDAIIEKAMQAANADKFNVLWRGDRAEFNYGHNSRSVRYNKSATGDVSDSMADSVFARMLAFYTSDPAQIERLMRRSGLYRAKWDSPRRGGTWLSKFVIESAITKHAADAAKEAARADAIRPSVERALASQLNPQGGPAPGLAAPTPASSIVAAPPFCVASPAPPPTTKRPPLIAAGTLLEMHFEPVKYVVPGYIAEGATLLAGRPKIGKSWLTLEIGIAVATGGTCLGGILCEQGDVLYLALEDNLRRLQSRMERIMPGGARGPNNLQFATEWPRASEGGLNFIREWLDEHPAARLVVVDILTMFRDLRSGKDTLYEQDYVAIKGLQALAMKKSIAIVIVHHTRKGGADADAFEKVSGTLGLSGAADTTLVLDRDSNGCTIYGRGRDIPEIETAVQFNRDTCKWAILGEAHEVRRTDERSLILDVLKDADAPMNPGEIAIATGMKRNNVDQLVYKLAKAGEIQKARRGLYIHRDRADLLEESTPDKNGKKPTCKDREQTKTDVCDDDGFLLPAELKNKNGKKIRNTGDGKPALLTDLPADKKGDKELDGLSEIQTYGKPRGCSDV